jgi:DegV family protein with EDD domain
MPDVKIVVDSTADLPPQLAADLNITVIPTRVMLGKENFKDGIDLTHEEFYERLKSDPQIPSTASPPPLEYELAFRDLLNEAKGVVSIHITAGLSSMYNNALIAAKRVSESQIAVLDSGNVTLAQGLIAIEAAKAANQGATFKEVKEFVQSLIPRVYLLATINGLEFLRKGGRVSTLMASIGTLLNIKPILLVYHGEISVASRVRAWNKALAETVELARAHGPLEKVYFIHANNPDSAKAMANMGQSLYTPPPEIFQAGPAIVTHGGPGSVGIAFLVK